jgi:hypothetical protein
MVEVSPPTTTTPPSPPSPPPPPPPMLHIIGHVKVPTEEGIVDIGEVQLAGVSEKDCSGPSIGGIPAPGDVCKVNAAKRLTNGECRPFTDSDKLKAADASRFRTDQPIVGLTKDNCTNIGGVWQQLCGKLTDKTKAECDKIGIALVDTCTVPKMCSMVSPPPGAAPPPPEESWATKNMATIIIGIVLVVVIIFFVVYIKGGKAKDAYIEQEVEKRLKSRSGNTDSAPSASKRVTFTVE